MRVADTEDSAIWAFMRQTCAQSATAGPAPGFSIAGAWPAAGQAHTHTQRPPSRLVTAHYRARVRAEQRVRRQRDARERPGSSTRAESMRSSRNSTARRRECLQVGGTCSHPRARDACTKTRAARPGFRASTESPYPASSVPPSWSCRATKPIALSSRANPARDRPTRAVTSPPHMHAPSTQACATSQRLRRRHFSKARKRQLAQRQL